jgi:hypothetical protein
MEDNNFSFVKRRLTMLLQQSLQFQLFLLNQWLFLCFCSSVEAITLLAVAGFFTVLIVTALCYISWHGKFSKSNAATLPKNKHQDNSSPKQNVQRYVFYCKPLNLGFFYIRGLYENIIVV